MAEGIHQIGADAVAALKALNAAKAAKKSKTAKANELIEERNELAKPLLQQVHDSIVAGHPVNGCSTWSAWAKYAGWSKRALNYIINGRKPQTGNSSSRSSFLTRIAEAKQKVGDIRRAYDAPFKPGEVKDSRVLDQIDPIIAPVFAEFCKLISPDGYTADFNGRHWFVNEDAFADEVSVTHLVHGNKTWCGFSRKDIGSLQLDQNGEYDCADCRKAKEQSKPITHIRVSPRKALCQTRFVNRKIKGAVYAKKGEEVTCPDCIAIRDRVVIKGTLQEAREKALAKNRLPAQLNKKERLAYTTLKATFDKLAKDFGDGGISAVIWRSAVTIHENTNIQRTIFRKRSGHFMNFMKQVRERMEAEIRDHGTRMSEPTQVAIVINDPPVTYDTEAYAKAETWSQKRCIIGSPENLAWSADLKARRELQEQIGEVGNLDGDDEEDEIEEQL